MVKAELHSGAAVRCAGGSVRLSSLILDSVLVKALGHQLSSVKWQRRPTPNSQIPPLILVVIVRVSNRLATTMVDYLNSRRGAILILDQPSGCPSGGRHLNTLRPFYRLGVGSCCRARSALHCRSTKSSNSP
ncbi:uncharacterized protein [Physcomitrium patens]